MTPKVPGEKHLPEPSLLGTFKQNVSTTQLNNFPRWTCAVVYDPDLPNVLGFQDPGLSFVACYTARKDASANRGSIRTSTGSARFSTTRVGPTEKKTVAPRQAK